MQNHRYLIFFLVLLIFLPLVGFPLFLHLGSGSVFIWDESLRAVNAIEMIMNSNPVVVHYNGEPDLRNTKPPFAVWMQALSMKLFGFDQLGLRLPSAIAGLFTLFFILFFSYRYLGTYTVAFWTALILVTSAGFNGIHITRTGDTDAFLVLFLTIGSFCYFLYLQQDNKHSLMIVAAALCFAFAVLTKGIVGLIPLPGLLIYTIYRKRLQWLLTSKAFYGSIVLALLIPCTYFILREYMAPGYLNAMITNDILGRAAGERGHEHPFWYYLRNMVVEVSSSFQKAQFLPWAFLIIPAFIVNLFYQSRFIRDLNIFLAVWAVIFLLIISSVGTKLFWYAAPVYPFFALMIALSFNFLFQKLRECFKTEYQQSWWTGPVMSILLTVIIFDYPYITTIERITAKKDSPWHEEHYGSYFKTLQQEKPELKSFVPVTRLVFEGNISNGQILFWSHVFNQESYDIQPRLPGMEFESGEVVVTCDDKVVKQLQEQFETDLLHREGRCLTFELR